MTTPTTRLLQTYFALPLGDYYWKLNQVSFEEGYPRKIVDDWGGLPAQLDAAVTDYDGDTYFFKVRYNSVVNAKL